MTSDYCYMPVRGSPVPSVVGEQMGRIGFQRKRVDSLNADEMAYVTAMREAPKEKVAREAAFLTAYAKLLTAGGVPEHRD